VFKGDSRWNGSQSPEGESYQWDATSTYIKNPPYFEGMTMHVGSIDDLHGARVLGLFGDSITTDHISPAGNIKGARRRAASCRNAGVAPADFNLRLASRQRRRDGARYLRQHPHQEPDVRRRGRRQHPVFPRRRAEKLAIYDAAMKYKAEGTPLVVIAGKEYGTGSSRDWAAKGTNLLGVKRSSPRASSASIRSNLVGMGVLPLQFIDGDNAAATGGQASGMTFGRARTRP
jgi:aconitate hydratase